MTPGAVGKQKGESAVFPQLEPVSLAEGVVAALVKDGKDVEMMSITYKRKK